MRARLFSPREHKYIGEKECVRMCVFTLKNSYLFAYTFVRIYALYIDQNWRGGPMPGRWC